MNTPFNPPGRRRFSRRGFFDRPSEGGYDPSDPGPYGAEPDDDGAAEFDRHHAPHDQYDQRDQHDHPRRPGVGPGFRPGFGPGFGPGFRPGFAPGFAPGSGREGFGPGPRFSGGPGFGPGFGPGAGLGGPRFGPGFPPGFGPRGFGPRGFGPGRGGHEGRGGRGKGRRGNVRAAVLALLVEEPRHGYAIMTELAERSGGLWRPSPGSVYPVLQQLQDEGLVSVQESDGRRVFSLTDAGRSYVAEHPDEVREPWHVGDSGPGRRVQSVMFAVQAIGVAADQVARLADDAQTEQALAVLEEARRALYRILAGEPEAPGSSQPGEPGSAT